MNHARPKLIYGSQQGKRVPYGVSSSLRPAPLPANEEVDRTLRRWVRKQTDFMATPTQLPNQAVNYALDSAIEFGWDWYFRIDC